jgi:hypothetical protein
VGLINVFRSWLPSKIGWQGNIIFHRAAFVTRTGSWLVILKMHLDVQNRKLESPVPQH